MNVIDDATKLADKILRAEAKQKKKKQELPQSSLMLPVCMTMLVCGVGGAILAHADGYRTGLDASPYPPAIFEDAVRRATAAEGRATKAEAALAAVCHETMARADNFNVYECEHPKHKLKLQSWEGKVYALCTCQ